MKLKPSATMALLASAALLCPACAPQPTHRPAIGHYLRSGQAITRLRNVVFVSMHAEQGTDQVAADMTKALAATLRTKGLFHLSLVSNSDAACRQLPLTSRQPLPMSDLSRIRNALQCDAVLLGSVNHFRQYPNMQMGIYVRLLDLKKGNLAWAVDHVWDANDSATKDRISSYYADRCSGDYSSAQASLGLMSPRAFAEFIAYEAAGTLPSPNQDNGPDIAARSRTNTKYSR